MKGAKQFWIEFVEWTKKRNLNFKEKKAPQQNLGKLKHGIEKSNKLFEKQVPESIVQQPLIQLTLQDHAHILLNIGITWA